MEALTGGLTAPAAGHIVGDVAPLSWLILPVQPVLATVIALIVRSGWPSPTQLVGIALVLGGALLGSARTRPSLR